MRFESCHAALTTRPHVRHVPSRFVGGFEGTFADTNEFFGGLEILIGPPSVNVSGAIEAEHCNVRAGEFGASTEVVESHNYKVRFCPLSEYLFVADYDRFERECGKVTGLQAGSRGLSAGTDPKTKKQLPLREHWDLSSLLIVDQSTGECNAVRMIRESFEGRGWKTQGVSQELFSKLDFHETELMTLRMYTGPVRHYH